jgi:serine/threonine-protein phosphatase 6 regulatory ankyrin repeat subunit B
MEIKAIEYIVKWFWDIAFLIRLNRLLKRIPGPRRFACKEELVRGGVAFDAAGFVASAASGRLPEVQLFTCAGIRVNMPASDGNAALIMAARNGHEEIVSHLLDLDTIDTGAQNDAGDTALITAARRGKSAIVAQLLHHEQTWVNRANEAGDTALIVAARAGHEDITAKLLERPGIEVSLRNNADESALLEAARRQFESIVQQLQVKGAVEPELDRKVARWQLEQEDLFSEAEYLRAVRDGDVGRVSQFHVAGIDPNTSDEDKNSALIIAVREANAEMVDLLCDHKDIEVNRANADGDTPLIVAAREAYENLVATLLERPEIDVNTRSKADASALLEAARREHEGIVRELLSAGAEEPELERKVTRWRLEQEGLFSEAEYLRAVRDGDAGRVSRFHVAGMDPNTSDENKNGALIIAVREANAGMVALLCGHKDIEVNRANADGDTPLIVAAREGHENRVAALLEHPEIDVNTQNKAGASALLEAARREHEGIVRQLLGAGAEEPGLEKAVARWQLEQQGVFTESHFVRSVASGNVALARRYLQAGIDVNSQDERRETALIVAVRHRQLEMVELLVAQPGIDVNLPNPEGVSAVEIAAARDYADIVGVLQEAGADVDMQRVARRCLEDRGIQFTVESFISEAARGQTKSVAWFIDADMRPNAEDKRGDTALIAAVRYGHRPVVELLIERGADVNLANRFGVTALEAAERSGHCEIAELLREAGARPTDPSMVGLLDAVETCDSIGVQVALDQGASPDAYTEEGEPILTVAVRQRCHAVVDLLLERGASVDARDRELRTALMRAAELGLTGMIRSLLDADAPLDEIDGDGRTALALAVWHGQVEAVRMLMEAGADVRIRDASGRTLRMIAAYKRHPGIIELFRGTELEEGGLEADLLAAAARGDRATVKALLESGANPHVPDEAGNTPLALAASRGWIGVIEELAPDMALIDKANSKGDTPLMQAARAGRLDTVKLLVNRKAGVNRVNNDGETALLQAAVAGRGAVVAWLAHNGADPNVAAKGTTPLTESCYHGQMEAVEALMEKGADPNQKVECGFSPLMTAMLAGHETIVELLQNRGVELGNLEGQVFVHALDGDEDGLKALPLSDIDLDARDRRGWTSLMVASQEGFGGIVKPLLEAGADPNVRSRDGRTTALLEAARHGRTGVLELLISKAKKDASAATSALVQAAIHGHGEAIRLLAEKAGANINGLEKGRVPLVEAALRGHLQVVQVLLELGARKEKKSQSGLTAIMAAQLHDHDKVVELLIESGLEAGLKEASLLLAASEGRASEVDRLLSQPNPPRLDARDEEGRTALMRACEGGHLDVVDVLFRHTKKADRRAAASAKDHRGRTPLMWAAQGGSVPIVQHLLALNVDIHAESSDMRTALMEACRWGYYQIVKALLDPLDRDIQRVAVNHQDEHGNTPLSEALLQPSPRRQWDYRMIVQLLEECGAELGRESAEFLRAVQDCSNDKVKDLIEQVDFKALRLHGKTPLMLCAEAGCNAVAATLIDKGADVNATDLHGATALMLAVRTRHGDSVRLLLNSGADCDKVDEKECSALIRATHLEAEGIVGDLISAGANVNHRDSSGDTAPIVAARQNNRRLMELLLSGQCKPNLDRLDRNRRTALTLAHLQGSYTHMRERELPLAGGPIPDTFKQALTPTEGLLLEAGARKGWNEAEFIHAARDGDSEQMRALMADGVDVNIRDIDGNTALLIACEKGDMEIADLLIDEGASVEVRNCDERTPLMEAAKHRTMGVELVQRLYQADPNLDLNAQDTQGETALLEAARAGEPDTVECLVQRGANINAANRRGATPLIEMARHPHPQPIRILLERGANACARDADHRTAIIEAAKHGNTDILAMLLEHLGSRLPSRYPWSSKRTIVINAIDHESCTAVDWAERGGFHDCVQLLRGQGGKSVNETDYVVHTTPHGKCYHRYTCANIHQARNTGGLKRRLLREALRLHYEFCEVCSPSLEEIDWNC